MEASTDPALRMAGLDPERWRRISEIADQALELPPEGVSAFLDRACADDSGLRRQVEALLSADQRAGDGFLEHPGFAESLLESLESGSGIEGASTEMDGRAIGAWRIVRARIGRAAAAEFA